MAKSHQLERARIYAKPANAAPSTESTSYYRSGPKASATIYTSTCAIVTPICSDE